MINIKLDIKRLITSLIIIFLLLLAVYVFYFPPRSSVVTVFIVDSQIDEEFLNGGPVIITADTGHGSLVARIISSDTENVKLIPVDVADSSGKIWNQLYIDGINKIIKYKQSHPGERVVVNISLGFLEPEKQAELIRQLNEMGGLIVAAAGNNNSETPLYPAGFKGVLAVAGATREGKSAVSNYGDYVDIAAAGNLEYIERLYFPGQSLTRHLNFTGTSFSAPRVTALLAGLMAGNPGLSPVEAVRIIKATAIPIDDPLYTAGKLGAGIIDKDAAMNRLGSSYRIREQIRTVMIVITGLVLLLFLWQNYSYFSIFIFMLVLMVFIPFLYLIKDFFIVLTPQEWLVLLSTLFIVFLFSAWDWRIVILLFAAPVIYLGTGGEISGDGPGPGSGLNFTADYLIFPTTGLILIISEYILAGIIGKLSSAKMLLFFLGSFSGLIRFKAEKNLEQLPDNIIRRPLLIALTGKGSSKRNKILIRLLCRLDRPPIRSLLYYGFRNGAYQGYICRQLATVSDKEVLIKELTGYLQGGNRNLSQLAVKILSHIEPGQVLLELERLLKVQAANQNDKKADKQAVMEIIESYGVEAEGLSGTVKNLLEDKSEDMWVRYQALRTLAAIMTDSLELKAILKEHINDEDELVRMEAQAILQEDGELLYAGKLEKQDN